MQTTQKNHFYTTKLSRNVWSILGLPFDALSLQQTIDVVISAIDKQQRCFLTTPNLNFLIAAQRDADFYQSVIDSDINIADGMPIVWLAKLFGIPIKERVAGSDVFAALSELKGREKKIKVFFFGGKAGIAKQASEQLNKNSVGMLCCGYHDPGFVSVDEMSEDAIIQKINQAQPDFLVVALGAGKGQAWIQKNKQRLNAPVISHLGAVVNFAAGHVERAPIFFQKSGLEWLWRIKQEPLLWKRYFFDGIAGIKLFVVKALPLALYDRYMRASASSICPVAVSFDALNPQLLFISGSVKLTTLKEVKLAFDEVLRQGIGDVVLDFSKVTYIDARFVGLLVLFKNTLKEQGRELFLQGLTNRLRRVLGFHNVFERFKCY